jgi:hypothetical protein
MDQPERDYYLKQLFKSWLLVPSSSPMQTNGNEQNTTTDDNMGNEKMDDGKEESNEDGQEGAIEDEQVLID